jgi:hypothetical protein
MPLHVMEQPTRFFQIYQKAAKSLIYRVISLSEFKQLWLEQCPQIILMKPATDLCSTCQGFTVSLSKTGNLQEEEKELMLLLKLI